MATANILVELLFLILNCQTSGGSQHGFGTLGLANNFLVWFCFWFLVLQRPGQLYRQMPKF